MKHWILTLCLSSALPAFAGTDRGNPGDEYANAFASLGYDLAENLAKDPIPGVDANVLLAAVQKTTLHSEDSLELRGFPVDAINYPDPANPQIVISRQGWDRMAAEPHRRVFLAFHEYLAILGIDDSRYQVSSLLDRAKVCDRASAIRKGIEHTLKKSCYRIVPDDLLYVETISSEAERIETLRATDLAGMPGVQTLWLKWSGPITMEPGVLQTLHEMRSLYLGASVPDLGDCSFFRAMPKISSIDLDDSGRDGWDNLGSFRPLIRIGDSCFASLTHLQNLHLAIDGKFTATPGFFKGLKAEYVQVNGHDLDQISPDEFRGISVEGISFKQLDRDFDPLFSPAVAKASGLECDPSNHSRSPDGVSNWVLGCKKADHSVR